MNLNIVLISIGIFLVGYILNIFYITVLYHRALTHSAVKLTPISIFLLKHTANWVTGIDPKAWALMHRLHHNHSDKVGDPHSPIVYGIFGVAKGQLRSYQKMLIKLINKDQETSSIVSDIPFDVNYLNKKNLWMLPYLLHITIGILLAFATGHFIVGLAYYLGITSYPVQGWLVNSLAHRFGYRNFNIDDNSRNNLFIALTVFGEGYQNNHHAHPSHANFAHKKSEIDLGYFLCVIAHSLGIIRLKN